MTKKALLITGQESETVSTLARNLIHVGGISTFARQMKQMKAIGVEEMHLVTDWFTQDFETEIQNCSSRPEKIYIHSTKNAPLRLLEHNNEGNSWFLLEEGVIIDGRIINQVDQHPSPSVLSFIAHHNFLEERTANGIPLHINEEEGYFGSIAKLSSQTLSASVRKLNSLDGFPNALKAISRAEDCEISHVVDIPLYKASRRCKVDLVWFPVIRREDGDKGTEILINYCQKPTLDWPARFIHKPLEKFIVKHTCKLPITPNQLSIASGVLGLYVMYLFWAGFMIPALITAYITSLFFGVDGKLARVKLLQSKLGHFAYPLEKFIEYGWYIAIASYLAAYMGLAPYIMAAALILFQFADEIQKSFFHRMSNAEICNMGNFDRKFHLIAGSRNTHMWTLLPFSLFDQWLIGFSTICLYGIITFFVHQIRVVYHLKNLMIEQSETFADNFKKTKIL